MLKNSARIETMKVDYEEKLKQVDETIAKYRISRLNTEQKRDEELMVERMRDTRVKSLRIQAHQNYIVRYWAMNKKELILAIDKRVSDEIILTLPQDLLNNILNKYLTLKDKLVIRNSCKTMRMRLKIDKFEKQLMKFPENYIEYQLEKINIQNLVNINKNIKNYFDLIPSKENSKDDIVKVVKNYLGLCEQQRSTRNKAICCLELMDFVSGRELFLKKHKRFVETVLNKFEELMNNNSNIINGFNRKMAMYKKRITDLNIEIETTRTNTRTTCSCGRH